jgi:uncharacterized membrane protein
MDQIIYRLEDRPVFLPEVREITLDHPWRWLAAGWDDLRSAPAVSLTYGMAFLLASYLMVWLLFSSDYFFYLPALMAGFFLLSPILAFGLYATSYKLQQGERPTLQAAVVAWRGNAFNLLALGLMLLMAFLIWLMLANMVYAIFHSGLTPTLDNFIPVLFLSGDNPAFFFAGIFSGGMIAFAVFCLTAISVPMLLERKSDVFSAVITSLRAVIQNPLPMLLWASLIVLFVGIGLVTFLVGLVLFIPLLGHASWHAYHDLVESVEDKAHIS